MPTRSAHNSVRNVLMAVWPISIGLCALACTRAAVAQNELGSFGSPAMVTPAPTTQVDSAAGPVGIAAHEILGGNGTRAGYNLSHGNVLPQSVVMFGPSGVMQPNRDYWLDAPSGSIFFASSLSNGDNVTVTYRYLDAKDVPNSGTQAPGIQLSFGSAAHVGLFYGSSSNAASGLSTSTYGLSLNNTIGGSLAGTWSGLLYFANSSRSNNLALNLNGSAPAAPVTGPTKAGLDHLIVQSLNLSKGRWLIKGLYQDVGSQFGGFEALRAANAGNAAAVQQLTQLQSETGIKRTGLTLGYSLGAKPGLQDGISLGFNTINDGKGSILQQTAALQTGAMHLNYNSQQIGDQFTRFAGLSDANKADLQKAHGLWSRSLGIGFTLNGAHAKGKPPSAPGALDMNSQSFGDKDGSLQEQSVSLNQHALQFNWMHRSTDAAFNRLGDLSDAQKGALALDVFHAYDPQAMLQQVTPGDRNAIAAEAGMARNALMAGLALGKSDAFSFSDVSLATVAKGTTPAAGFDRQQIRFSSPLLSLDLTGRRVDPLFTGAAALTDIDKRYLALDILRQFNPDAPAAQVTPVMMQQAAQQTGFERSAMSAAMNLGSNKNPSSLTVNTFRIADISQQAVAPGTASTSTGSPAIQRSALAFTNRALSVNWMSQSISNAFDRIGTLTDVEKAQFGNEYGLSRNQLDVIWQLNKLTKLTFHSLHYGFTRDAAAAAVAAALKAGADARSVSAIMAAQLDRQSFNIAGKNLNFTWDTGAVAKTFDRACDLALAPADKTLALAELGFQRTDWAGHWVALKGLTLDGTGYNAADTPDQLLHNKFHQAASYIANKTMSLAYTADGDVASAAGQRNGTVSSLFSLVKSFSKGLSLSLSQNNLTTVVNSAPTLQSSELHLESLQTQPNSFQFDQKNVVLPGGQFQDSVDVNVHAKPTRLFSFSLGHSELTADAQNPSYSTNSVGIQWQATKQFAVVAGLAGTTATNKLNSDTVSVGLQGQPVQNITLAAKFDEAHNNAVNTKDTADIALSNGKPFNWGPVHGLTFTARYASLNDQRKLQNETMTGRAAWTVFNNQFLLDYSGVTLPSGSSTIERTYQFVTDSNPKRWLHGSFMYKDRTLIDGKEVLVRKFAADARIDRKTQFTYSFGTMPEDAKGNITPETTADLALHRTLTRFLTGQWFYKYDNNLATKIYTRSFGLGLTGKLDSVTTLDFAYSVDGNGFNTLFDHSDHFHLGFNRQVDANHTLGISAEIRTHDQMGLIGALQCNLDFHTIF
ncbi:MAG: hypothetical protein KGJ62_14285 [Armatimonadetes bacterium]|nr:hypothetical protein [Armatimonadota bacterium]MDE2207076.1 hypothetical protein [Armatimonadota bacterium]